MSYHEKYYYEAPERKSKNGILDRFFNYDGGENGMIAIIGFPDRFFLLAAIIFIIGLIIGLII